MARLKTAGLVKKKRPHRLPPSPHFFSSPGSRPASAPPPPPPPASAQRPASPGRGRGGRCGVAWSPPAATVARRQARRPAPSFFLFSPRCCEGRSRKGQGGGGWHCRACTRGAYVRAASRGRVDRGRAGAGRDNKKMERVSSSRSRPPRTSTAPQSIFSPVPSRPVLPRRDGPRDPPDSLHTPLGTMSCAACGVTAVATFCFTEGLALCGPCDDR